MENVAFVLWVCLFPLTTTIGNYFGIKNRQARGEKLPSEEQWGWYSLIMTIIWIVVAVKLKV